MPCTTNSDRPKKVLRKEELEFCGFFSIEESTFLSNEAGRGVEFNNSSFSPIATKKQQLKRLQKKENVKDNIAKFKKLIIYTTYEDLVCDLMLNQSR